MVGERPYGNSLGVGENDDVGVGHCLVCSKLRRVQPKNRAGRQHVVKRLPASCFFRPFSCFFQPDRAGNVTSTTARGKEPHVEHGRLGLLPRPGRDLVRIAVVFVIAFIDILISWKLAQEKKEAIVDVVALVVTVVVSSPVYRYFGLMLG